ncbi:MAG: nucleoside recognition domain-containing protein [Bacilli bacterium]
MVKFSSGKTTLDLIIQIFPLLAIWLGIMNIAKQSGLLEKASNFISPVLSKIFPEIPKGHESLGLISSNIIANLFGLGNAATPFGLKAMESLQKLNKEKDTASRRIITFLVINTCGVTLVPTTIISLRMMTIVLIEQALLFPVLSLVLFLSLLALLSTEFLLGGINETNF